MNYNSIRLIFNKAERMKRHVNLEGAGAWGYAFSAKETACAKALWLGAWYV